MPGAVASSGPPDVTYPRTIFKVSFAGPLSLGFRELKRPMDEIRWEYNWIFELIWF